MKFSVIIPARNPPYLEKCLAAINRSTLKPNEIIVVDDASTPALDSSIAKVIRVNQRKGAGHARNFGAKISTGEVLVFIDADVCVGPGTLSALLHSLNGGAAASQAIYCAENQAGQFFSSFENLRQHHNFAKLRTDTLQTISSYCVAIKRVDFIEAGGFSAENPRATVEDGDLGQDLSLRGKVLKLVREEQVLHLKRYSPGELLHRAFWMGFDKSRSLLQHPERLKTLRSGTPHSREKLASILLSPIPIFQPKLLILSCLLFGLLNGRFFLLCMSKRGLLFAVLSLLPLWLEACATLLGLCAGTIRWTVEKFSDASSHQKTVS